MSDRTHVDIAVIGGGVAGISAAALIAAGGRRVALVEREPFLGYHSSGRSAAVFSETYGSPEIRALTRASRAAIYTPPPGFADAPLIKARGVVLATGPDRAADLERGVAPLLAEGRSMIVDGNEVRRLCPLLRPDHAAIGLYEPEARDLDVSAMQHGYLRMLRANGGIAFLERTVTAIDRVDGVWDLHCGADRIAAPILVNAAGAWADVVARMAGVDPVGLQPRRRTAVLVAPPPGIDIATLPMLVDFDEQFYFKPDAGKLLLSPVDETPSDPCDSQPEEWDVAVAVDRVTRATTLEVRRVDHRWAGLRSFVSDGLPVVGFASDMPDFFWLAGQGGAGVQTAPALARLTADLLGGASIDPALVAAGVDPAAFAPDRLFATQKVR